jgi:hypothetical protein
MEFAWQRESHNLKDKGLMKGTQSPLTCNDALRAASD